MARQQDYVIDRISICLPAILASSAAFYIILQWRPTQRYDEFIVGAISWSASTKIQDLLAAPAALVIMALSALINVKTVNLRVSCVGSEATSVGGYLIWWSIAPFALLIGMLSGEPLERFFYAAVGLLIIFVLVYHRLFHLPAPQPQDEASLAVLSAVFFGLLPIATAVLLARLPEGWALLSRLRFETPGLLTTLAVSVTGITCWLLLAPKNFRSTLPALAALSQLSLPLFYFCLYPASFVTADGDRHRYAVSGGLAVVLAVVAAVSVLDVFARFRRHRHKPASWPKLISPLAVFALLLAVTLGATQPPHISDDDYHFGERLVGAMIYLAGGMPYVDYVPPHGIAQNDAPLFLSMLLHDGTASGLGDAQRLWGGLLALVAFLSIYRVTGHLALSFLCILLLSKLHYNFPFLVVFNFIFLVPFICLWLSAPLLQRPAVWIASWIATAPLLVLGIPPQGLVLVVASAPIAAAMTFKLFFAHDRQRPAVLPVVAAGLVGFVILLTPLRPMLFGAIDHVLTNSAINQTAYGIPWSASWQPQNGFGLAFEALRNSWIVVCVLLGAAIVLGWQSRVRRELLLPATAAVLFCLLIIPYGLGRIDPGVISRPGRVSIFAVTVLLPVALWPIMSTQLRAPLALVIVGLSAMLVPTQISLSQLRAATLSAVPTGPLVDGPRAGLHGLGVTMIDDVHLGRLQTLRRILDEELPPGQPYLDLSSRNAQYFYFSRVPPVATTAPYNMASPTQQRQAVERLAARPPQVVVMEAANVNHDGGGIALRNPILHRFVLDHYVPVYRRDFVIGRLRGSAGTAAHAVELDGRIIGAGRSEGSATALGGEELRVEDHFAIPFLAPGDVLRLPDGDGRRIVNLTPDGLVTLDGPLQTRPAGQVRFIWEGEPSRLGGYRSALLEFAFERRDLLALPVAWGRSETSLARRMVHRHAIPEQPASLHGLSREGYWLRVTGGDPFATFDLSPLQVSGGSVDLIRLRFACRGQRATPRLQLFWWGGAQTHPSEILSLRLMASNGPLIVPMFAAHRWSSMPSISGLRIDLDNPDACDAIQIVELSLLARIDLD